MKLNIIFGPMKAGKTEYIIRLYNKYNIINKKVLIINHMYDTQRTNKDNIIQTHDKKILSAYSSFSLLSVINEIEYNNADIIIIDESQFFNDLEIFIKDQIENSNKTFYVFGLNGDYNQQKIGQLNDLIPLSDTITHLTAYCEICKDGTSAPFTKKLENSILSDINYSNYISVCRKHLK